MFCKHDQSKLIQKGAQNIFMSWEFIVLFVFGASLRDNFDAQLTSKLSFLWPANTNRNLKSPFLF